MKIKEIIVVEGKDDTTAIQQAVHADTIETNGSAINEEIIEKIKLGSSDKRSHRFDRSRLSRAKNP